MVTTNKIIYIYTLSCPKSGLIRYVGKSINLVRRIDSHLNVLRRIPCSMWIQSLKKEGLKPILEIIDETYSDWQNLEQYWIAQFRAWGFKLLNLTDGGEGHHGIVQSLEHKQNRHNSMLGKNKGIKRTQEYKDNLSKHLLESGRTKGFKNGKSKYTIDQIRDIKRLLSEDSSNKAAIARQLGVNVMLVYEIASGKKWKDII